ncbi:MAG: hypothetical protein AAGC60_13090 [Acidobacteriota bacterium]
MLGELRVFQTLLGAKGGLPDLLIIGIDANCDGLTRARKHIEAIIDSSLFPTVALAVPDPHVERWFLCDPRALRNATDAHIALPRRKCDRDLYKQMLSSALVEAGNVVTLGGAEFAEEIVAEMDFFGAGKAEPSLKIFLDDVRNAMKRWASSGLGGP